MRRIVILSPAIASKEFFPLNFSSSTCKSDDCPKVVKKQLLQHFTII